ncbi:MAG: glycosyltransferase family 4 protein [Pyrinomonadaceae bacterium]|nr:glycosyltransferase family 4 protein [Pyrinomonadaceae bacterium]
MRIGLDGISLVEARTGVGHYTFELARGLAEVAPDDEFELVSPFPFTSLIADGSDQGLPSNLRIVRAEVNALKKRWWTIGLPLYARQSALTLFHGTNYNVPLWHRCPTVVTIHDLSLFLYPETHEDHLVRRAHRRLPTMARTADLIITPSESVKREVCEHLPVKASKVVAVPEAPRRSFRPIPLEHTIETRRRLGIEDDFLLFVGTVEPRKNLLTLVQAFDEILRTTTLRPQLVIAGKRGWLVDDLFSYIKRTGIDERILFTGYVSDEDLCALYSSCRVCVYPSLYEGFGLPPLEAMACGAPVVTTRIPPIIETVGQAARLVVPKDVRALAQSIIELLQDADERQRLSYAGLERAAEFTWERTARRTLDVYHQALGAGAEKQRAASA